MDSLQKKKQEIIKKKKNDQAEKLVSKNPELRLQKKQAAKLKNHLASTNSKETKKACQHAFSDITP